MKIIMKITSGTIVRRYVLLTCLALLIAGCQTARSTTKTPLASITVQNITPAVTISKAATATNIPSPTYTPEQKFSPSPTATASATSIPTPGAGMVYIAPGRVVVPILMYHHISDTRGDRYVIPVDAFREQMQYLYDEGYQTVSISRVAEVIRDGGSLPEKPVVLTFDDGYLNTYENAFPIMEAFDFIGVTYIITSTLEKEKAYGYMQVPELKELLAAGWEIGSHSVTHSDLNKTKLGMGNEMKESKSVLEKRLGVPVKSFSYPYGIANSWIKDRVEEYGYQSAVGIGILVTQSPGRLYYLSRREVYRSLPLFAFITLLTPGEEEQAANNLSTQTPTPPE